MIVRKTLNVSLTSELHDFIYGLVAGGTYGNASEVVRAGLRILERHEGTLRRKRRAADTTDGRPVRTFGR